MFVKIGRLYLWNAKLIGEVQWKMWYNNEMK